MSSIVDNLIPDVQVMLAQGVVYLAALVSAHVLIIKPLWKLQQERKRRTLGKQESALQLEVNANKLQGSYDESMRKGLEEARKLRVAALQAGHGEAQRVTSLAQEEARQGIQKAKEQINSMVAQERAKLPNIVKDMSAIVMQKLTNNVSTVVIFGLALFVNAIAHAAEKQVEEGINFNNTGWPIFQFIMFLFVIYIAARKAIAGMLTASREKLAAELASARDQLASVQAKVQALELKLSNSSKEIAELIEQYSQDGEKEKNILISEGNKIAEQLKLDTERVVKVAVAQGKELLRREIVELTMQAIEQQLTSNNVEAIGSRLKDEAVQGINQIM